MDNETVIPLPVDLSVTIQRLRSDLENVQRELDQALGVWRSSLINEKKEFQALLQDKEKRWSDQESRIEQDRGAYELKIKELEDHYKSQIDLLEQNALQALNELDDSWQRDKLTWNQEGTQRIKTLESREVALSLECQKREERIQALERGTDLPEASAPIEPPAATPTDYVIPHVPTVIEPIVSEPVRAEPIIDVASDPTTEIVVPYRQEAPAVDAEPSRPTASAIDKALELLEGQIAALDQIVKVPSEDAKSPTDSADSNGFTGAFR